METARFGARQVLHLCMCSACFLQLAAGVVGSCGTGKAGYKQQEGTEADLLQDVELLAKAACLKRSAENTRPPWTRNVNAAKALKRNSRPKRGDVGIRKVYFGPGCRHAFLPQPQDLWEVQQV